MRKLQFFISSPGDVCEERALASRVIERLQSEYMGRVALETMLWEHEPLVATSTFQVQLVKPSETDVVISILWSRLGTRLPAQFTRADGSRYESGTEYEFEEAMEGFRRNGKPDLLVYRRTAPPSVRLDDERDLMERLSQKKKLDEFIEKWFHDRTEGTLVAAFHPFASPSDFEILLENHLRRLIERQLPRSAVATAQARDVWKKGSPFRGLAAFELEHAPVFFGRTRAVSDILQALRQQSTDGRSLVLILGMSGGGKSSVVRAGVLPMLTKPGVIEGITFWRRAVFRPTDVRGDIFAGLARALLKDEALPSLDGEGTGADEFAQILRQSPQAATAMVRNALAREAQSDKAGGDKANGRLALVIDQMEEMFTHEGILPEHREAFIDVIDAFARSGRVWVICTLRSDFYPRLAALPKLTALKEGAGQYDLMPPNASEIGQMIRLPTRAAGLRFEEDPTTNESLDDMLRDAALERPEILPLLQFTLEELYQRRTEDGLLTLAAYRELGGVEGSLAQRAEAVFQDLPKDVQAELPKVLNALVSIEQDGHETVGRKRAPWSDRFAGKSRALIDTFVENRLFVTELADDGSAVVTVAHEALLWHWPRVMDWVAQNRENLRVRSRIGAAAERWSAESKSTDLLLPHGKPLVEAESLLDQGIELQRAGGGIHRGVDRARTARPAHQDRRCDRRRGAGDHGRVLRLLRRSPAQSREPGAPQRRDRSRDREADHELHGRACSTSPIRAKRAATPSLRARSWTRARRASARSSPRSRRSRRRSWKRWAPSTRALDCTIRRSSCCAARSRNVARCMARSTSKSRARMDRLGEVLKLKAAVRAGRKTVSRGAGDASRDARQRARRHRAQRLRARRPARPHGRVHAGGAAVPRSAGAAQEAAPGAQSRSRAEPGRPRAESLRPGLVPGCLADLLREAVAMRREIHDGPHPQLAEALNNLGFVIDETGQSREAEQLFREALEMKRVLLGTDHPEIAIGLNNVAFALYEQRKYDAGAGFLRERAGDAAQAPRQGSSRRRDDAQQSGVRRSRQGRPEDGDRAVARVPRDLHARARRRPSFRRARQEQSRDVDDGANDFASAESLLRDALEVRSKRLGPEHADVAATMTLLAGVLIETKRYDEALQLCGRSTCAIP